MSESERATGLSPAYMFDLRSWGDAIYRTYDLMPYLVGSVHSRRDYRDVDVRVLAPDWLAACPDEQRKVINVAFSNWAARVTRLPVDFQFQQHDEFHSYDGQWRSALFIPRPTADPYEPTPEADEKRKEEA